MGYQPVSSNYHEHPDHSLAREDCSPSHCARSPTSSFNTNNYNHSRPVLGELTVHANPNAQTDNLHLPTATPLNKRIASGGRSADSATPESLAEDLENFHIESPPRVDNRSEEESSLSDEYLVDPATSIESRECGQRNRSDCVEVCEDETERAELQLSGGSARQQAESRLITDISIQQAIEKQEARDFDWLLSLPCDADRLLEGGDCRRSDRSCSVSDATDSASEGRQIHFGCNLLQHRARSGSDLAHQHRTINTYMLVATRLGDSVQGDVQTALEVQTESVGQSLSVGEGEAMPMVDALLTPERTAPAVNYTGGEKHQVSPLLLGNDLEVGSVDHRSQSLTRSPASSVSRIEDTIEELDRLEDEFEAVHSLVRVDRVPSPDKQASAKPARVAAGSGGNGSSSGSAKKAVAAKPGAARKDLNTAAGLSRTPSLRRAAAAAAPSQAKKQVSMGTGTGTGPATSTANKRLSITRPTSLLPPKPPVKSSKPPTIPTFELPGDAVARRLKEQREKRLSAALAGTGAVAAAAASPVQAPRKTRQVKPPTIASFELPGEAISRRKREEHEAKLRRQEEEEKKRREFKARPIRVSAVPSSQPRETATSRARQKRMSMIGESSAAAGAGAGAGGANAGGSKRFSMVSTTSSSGRAMPQRVTRGRGSSIDPLSSTATQTSRAPSTSTGSISGMRSAISAEDVQQQKARGKDIYHRDNYLSVDRNQEKRDREAIAKQARQEAAERSRMLSREWAEKQRQRAKKLMAPAAASSADVSTR